MVSIILVEPQMGENIGAAARAMKNFGLDDLRIVSPRDGWPSEKAIAMSVGAVDIIESAKVYDEISAAVADFNYIYATTAATRSMNKEHVMSKDIANEIPNSNVAIMFGRESSGLNNDEIGYANKVLTIDTDVEFSSLNLGHAVAVICNELFKNNNQNRSDLANEQDLATEKDLSYFLSRLDKKLDSSGFYQDENRKKHSSQKIRNIFKRIDKLSKNEVQILHGILGAKDESF